MQKKRKRKKNNPRKHIKRILGEKSNRCGKKERIRRNSSGRRAVKYIKKKRLNHGGVNRVRGRKRSSRLSDVVTSKKGRKANSEEGGGEIVYLTSKRRKYSRGKATPSDLKSQRKGGG